MSRKNNLSRRSNQRDFDRQREVDLKAKQEEKRLRKLASLNAREEARKATHAATKAAQVKATLAPALGRISKKKAKGFRIKKNVMVKGIKIVDAESKNEALRRLKAEQALSLMETDD